MQKKLKNNKFEVNLDTVRDVEMGIVSDNSSIYNKLAIGGGGGFLSSY